LEEALLLTGGKKRGLRAGGETTALGESLIGCTGTRSQGRGSVIFYKKGNGVLYRDVKEKSWVLIINGKGDRGPMVEKKGGERPDGLGGATNYISEKKKLYEERRKKGQSHASIDSVQKGKETRLEEKRGIAHTCPQRGGGKNTMRERNG